MIPFLISALASVTLTGVSVPLLRRAQLVDVPNHRSSHGSPIPRGGGLAVMGALVLAVVLVGVASTTVPVLAAAVVLSVVGLIDDARSLASGTRLTAQILVAAVAVLVIVNEFGSAELWAPAFVVVSLLGVVAFVNAFNFMDGVNGISALNAAVAGGWFVWVGYEYENPQAVIVGAALAGAALGFLPWNARSKVFLGDVGSYGFGALVALIAVTLWAGGVPGPVSVAPLLVYLVDTGWTIAKRWRAGHSITEAHRDHVYQRLVRAGWPHLASAIWVAVLSTIVCVAVASLYAQNPWITAGVVIALLSVYLGSPRVTRGAWHGVPAQ